MTGPATFPGPNGHYRVLVIEAEGNDGILEVRFADAVERWNIDLIESDEGGRQTYSGMADVRRRWGDMYWFVFEPEADPPVMTYWGNQVIARADVAVD